MYKKSLIQFQLVSERFELLVLRSVLIYIYFYTSAAGVIWKLSTVCKCKTFITISIFRRMWNFDWLSVFLYSTPYILFHFEKRIPVLKIWIWTFLFYCRSWYSFWYYALISLFVSFYITFRINALITWFPQLEHLNIRTM